MGVTGAGTGGDRCGRAGVTIPGGRRITGGVGSRLRPSPPRPDSLESGLLHTEILGPIVHH